MKYKFFILVVMLGSLLPSYAKAQVEQQKNVHRLALVIGNRYYTGQPWGELKSPVKDARDVAALLRNAGFDVTDKEAYFEDATGKELRKAIDLFGAKVRAKRRDILTRDAQQKEGIVAIVFFSGHGFMVDDAAYLAGVDANGIHIEDVMQQSVKLNRLVQDLTPDERDVDILSVLLIDACRSQVSLPSRVGSASKGMLAVRNNPFGRISGFGRISVLATTDGRASFDGRSSDENSVFTAALLDAAQKPDAPQNFSEFVARIAKNTPRIARERFRVDQFPDIHQNGAAYDFFWSANGEKRVEAEVAALNSVKGTDRRKRTGWIWIGDFLRAANGVGNWQIARFAPVKDTSDQLPDPKRLIKDDEIQILANLNVRDKFPIRDASCSGKYQECATLLGTIPKGLKVTVIESPKAFGQQNWVKVEFDAQALY